MAKVITFTNQKGGVGKTTTALNIGGGLNSRGFRVLFIDMDAQCNLTISLKGKMHVASSRELLTHEVNPQDVIQHVAEGDLVPGSANLSTMDFELTSQDKATRLKEAMDYYRGLYDYIIVDTPPTLGIVTINVLGVTDEVVIPTMDDIFSLQGLAQLSRTVNAVRKSINPNLRINGILITSELSNGSNEKLIENAFNDIANILNTKIYKTVINKSARVKKATTTVGSIFKYDINCKQAIDYKNLIDEIQSVESVENNYGREQL